MAKSKEIGAVHVGVSAELDEFITDMQAAEAQTEASTAGMTQAVRETESEFEQLNATASRVQGVISKLLLPVALISSITGAIAIVKRFTEANKEAEASIRAIGDARAKSFERAKIAFSEMADLEKRLAQIELERAEATEQINEKRSLREAATILNEKGRVDEQARLLAGLEIEANVKAEIAAAEKDAAAERKQEFQDRNTNLGTINTALQQMREQAQALSDELLPSDERIEASFERQAAAIRKLNQLSRSQDQEQFDALMALLDQVKARKLADLAEQQEKERKADEEREKRRQDAIDRQGAAFGAAIQKGLDAAITASLGQTEAKLNRLTIAAERTARILQKLNRNARP